jgi:iron transport multicopper oxidase
MQRIVALLMAVATSSLAAQAADVTLDWNVGYVQNVNPDGKFERRAISVNGQFPTPIIVSDKAEEVSR